MFGDEEDFDGFSRILAQGLDRFPVRLLGWCLMPDHWHLLLRPYRADTLGRFIAWVGVTHARRHHDRYNIRGGHLYGGRFKSFPVQNDDHIATVCRYIEGNPRRAKLVRRAENWRWSSLAAHADRPVDHPEDVAADEWPTLTAWPVRKPAQWVQRVNEPFSAGELDGLRVCVNRGRPFGDSKWLDRTVQKLGLLHTIRSRGRPRKVPVSKPAKPRS